jgi:thiol-disulfide isomerase/thioredoxin
MKKLLFTILVFTCFNLLSSTVNASNDNYALGVISEDKLLSDYSEFNKNYQAFSVSAQDVEIIAQWPENLKVEVFFGTWCHDSEREVPKLLKLFKANKHITPKLVALDYQKQDPEQSAEKHRVKYTPTIIIYKDASKKEELGRIIERPKTSLVEDINQLLQ